MSPRIATVGDAFEFVRNGKSVKQTPDSGGLPVTRIETIADGQVDGQRVGYAGLSLSSNEQWLLKPGDILFSHINSVQHVGKCAIYEGKPAGLIHGMNLLALRPSNSLHPRFALYALRQPDFRAQLLQFVNKAVNQASVSITNLKSLPFPLPPLPEQRRIAAILDKADALRRKRQRAIDLLDSLTQSIFMEMFGPLTQNLSGLRNTIQDACTKITDGTHHSPKTREAGIPYITAKHLRPDGLDFYADPWFVSEADHKKIYARCNPEKGDVLYIKDGATTGIAGINPYDFEFSMLSSLALLKPNRNRCLPEYLAAWLNSDPVKRNMIGSMSGAGITRLTLAKIKASSLALPSISSQKTFAGRIGQGWKARELGVQSLRQAENMFSSLQHRAFSGQL